ncbi:MAG TPA: hypothetical protein VHX39_33340, partial [Acetobacteraceae bacterium]|nr:hypothetical protein [Acetobacteraceae bacterium]
MVEDFLPADVRDFVARYIDTIVQLEALLLLRADESHDWNVTEMAARLHTTGQEAAKALQRLTEDGLAWRESERYRLGCQDVAL